MRINHYPNASDGACGMRSGRTEPTLPTKSIHTAGVCLRVGTSCCWVPPFLHSQSSGSQQIWLAFKVPSKNQPGAGHSTHSRFLSVWMRRSRLFLRGLRSRGPRLHPKGQLPRSRVEDTIQRPRIEFILTSAAAQQSAGSSGPDQQSPILRPAAPARTRSPPSHTLPDRRFWI